MRPREEIRQPTGIHLTLPFSALFNEPATQKAVERSRSRWHWFAEGRRRNPALGTLGYLPVEIRWLIWREVAGGRTWQQLVASVNWDPPSLNRLPYEEYFLWLDRLTVMFRDFPKNVPLPVLRKGIPLAGLEFDEMYLSTTALILPRVSGANRVLDKNVAPWQLTWIRHLSFILDSGGDDWLQFFERDLPPNLTKVTLDLNHRQHLQPYNQYKNTIICDCEGEACPGRRRKHHTNLSFLAKKTARDVDLLEIVVAKLMRVKPAVVIRLSEGNGECPLCHNDCQRTLEETRLNKLGRRTVRTVDD
ncbi:MAG: hypothetical protein Q9184_004280 [Pyrenodesmia sp. 2 TL-2023]